MQCPECQFKNFESAKFCNECGHKLEPVCPECGTVNRIGSKFCCECGCNITSAKEIIPKTQKTENLYTDQSDDMTCLDYKLISGERKHVTVLFSDLTGYTAMSEKLDPEEVKEITTHIFDEISKIINNYEGFIEKFVGDAVMAMFGAERSHEDDPVRAIRAAMKIHKMVQKLSPRYVKIIGQTLSMHTGINTGLVVTGDVNLEKGVHGVAGDPLNVAARISNIGNADDIMVSHDTFCQVEGFFNFKPLKPVKIKGKENLVQIYRVISLKENPIKVHRLQGVRSGLIGRNAEMQLLKRAVARLKQGQGTIISICGVAGTGKSRLIEEFKSSLDLKKIQWREGYSYPYTQEISYTPFIDIINRALRIKEDDTKDAIKEKIEKGIEYLADNKDEIVPYVGGLYEFKYPEIEEISPEFWKSGLQKAMHKIVLGLTKKGPTILCFEDLHWADPSSIGLLHYLLSNFRYPAIFLCVYRPVFSLFTTHQKDSIGQVYEEINLLGLSPTEVHEMVESLLKTRNIPFELKRFVQQLVEGNPFFLEEVINSLIESGTLMEDNGTWELVKPIKESEIPATIQGVLSARFDRLESEEKRILQEASVIGRAFFYYLLKHISIIKDQYEQCISALERLDLIRAKSFKPDLEYIFKHALTQEVVYNGILKKERRILHEKIGLVMEQLFSERLSEFYETLAFHFKKGLSHVKAVDYLMKSAEKSLGRYSLEESHKSYKEAFDILTRKEDKSKEEEELLIDLLIKWAFVYYSFGKFDELLNIFRAHETLAGSLKDKVKKGMFNAWLGFALFMNGDGNLANPYLDKAMEQAKASGDQNLLCHAYTWNAWNSLATGLLDKGVALAERGHEIAKTIGNNPYLYHKPLGLIGMVSLFTGDYQRAFAVGKDTLDYGKKCSNSRSITMGHICISFKHQILGDIQAALESFERAIEASADPVYKEWGRCFLGGAYLLAGQVEEAEDLLKKTLECCTKIGYGIVRRWANAYLAAVNIIKGQVESGIYELEKEIKEAKEIELSFSYVFFEFLFGFACLQKLMEGDSSFGDKAEDHLKKAVQAAEKIGARFVLGNACLSLGLLYSIKGQTDQARTFTSEAARIFEQCKIDSLLQQAKELLNSLG